jgi:acetoin utilization protein AcuC
VSSSVRVVWGEELMAYDFGRGHPLRPLRLELTIDLLRELGVLALPNVEVVAPTAAGSDLLELVHDRDYIAAVQAAPDDLMGRLSGRYGLGTSDNPVFAQMHEASDLVTGASVDAARAVWEGSADHSVNIAGGLHHAMRDRAKGFCIYDDPAIAIAWLLANGATRVAYVDIDVHHGNGVQAAFYGDPRVLTISVHESGRWLFPGTGFADETGVGEGIGTSVNVALPPGTDDAGWLRALDAVVPQAVRAYAPQVLVTQLGCDTHALDDQADLMCSVDGQRRAYAMLHDLAHEVCGGKWVLLGGGGYEIVQVVPRAWTLAVAEAADLSLSGSTPEDWQYATGRRTGEVAPASLTDGRDADFVPWEAGAPVDAHDPVDRAIAATRRESFPLLGLDEGDA